MRVNGEVEMLPAGGPVLGILKNVEYHSVKLELRRGDTLVMYSDGVTEARSPQEDEYGEDRLLDTLRKLEGSPAPVVVDAVYKDVEGFMAGATAADDITVVVARRV
jgi:sigma-B regulation protein RsbU (phosphoserine phosphatase)